MREPLSEIVYINMCVELCGAHNWKIGSCKRERRFDYLNGLQYSPPIRRESNVRVQI